MRKKIIAFLMLLVLSVELVSCGSNSKNQTNKVVGSWRSVEDAGTILVFNSDGTATFSATPNQQYKWTLRDNSISLEATDYASSLLIVEDETPVYLQGGDLGIRYVSVNTDEETCERIADELRQSRIEAASVTNLKQLWSELSTNEAKATIDYDGKYCITTVTVMNISRDSFEWMTMNNGYMTTVAVDMPTEEIAKLHDGEGITVCGLINILSNNYIVISNAFIADEYVDGNEQTGIDHKYLIDNFDGDPYHIGRISWTAGSLAYFTTNYGVLHKVDSKEFSEAIVGKQWNAKYYAEANKEITVLLNEDGTAIETENGKENNWKWKFTSYLHFPASRESNYEVRKVDDSMYIIYDIMYGEAMPHWLLWQDEDY